MREPSKERSVLVRISKAAEPLPKRLRVQVTLYGMTAAVVEELAEMTGRARAEIVRRWTEEAVSRRTVYEDPSK